VMDAISFVLGVKSAQLRSSQLKDLIHRQPNGGGRVGNSAHVQLVLATDEGEELRFKRTYER
jgi:structural maintenance of chromosome 1